MNFLGDLDSYLGRFPRERLVVTFVNIAFMEIFDRWHSCFKNCSNEALLVVALDKSALDYLEERNIPSVLVAEHSFENFLSKKDFNRHEKQKLSILWRIRWSVFERVISHGIELIHSDSDALWLRNPMSELKSKKFDMITSIGRSWPTNIKEQWGFVLCMGFFALRPTEASRSFTKLVRERLNGGETDDQVSANQIILENKVTWSEHKNGNKETFASSIKLRVLAISDEKVSRKSQGLPCVFHPYLRGNIEQKIHALEHGVHEIRAREGLRLSYYRRNPILKAQETTVDTKERLVFIHIPKTGGTSFQEMFALSGRGHIRAADIPQTKNTHRIAICRNPYSRAVSAFRYLTNRKRLPPHDHEESEYVFAYRNDFKGFVENIIGSMDIYRSIHLIPQNFFILSNNEIAVDEIIPLEDLPKKIWELATRFDKNLTFQHRNRSGHEDSNTYYDDKLRSIVARAYSRDFSLLGYDPTLDANSCLDSKASKINP